MTPRVRLPLLSFDGPRLVLADDGESWLLGLVVGESCPRLRKRPPAPSRKKGRTWPYVYRWAFARISPGEALALAEGSENVLRDVFSRSPVLLYDEGPRGYAPVHGETVLPEEDLPDADARLELTPEALSSVLAALAAPVPPRGPLPGPPAPPSKDP